MLVAASAGLTAAGYLARLAYRASKAVERAVTDLAGGNGQNSLRREITLVRDEIVEVKGIAERSEQELHPNGGSSMRDDVRLAVDGVEDARVRAEEAREEARRAADAVNNLHTRSQSLTFLLEQLGEEGKRERAEIKEGQIRMKAEIAQDYADNTAMALEILAENGGPDLRGKIPLSEHVHDVPIRVDALTTGTPHPLPEDRA